MDTVSQSVSHSVSHSAGKGTVWPTVVRTDGWRCNNGACQGPEDRKTTIQEPQHGVPGYGRQLLAQTRQDKTRQACWPGWCRHFARCDLGRYLASRRAASGISRYLDCTEVHCTNRTRPQYTYCPGPGSEPGPGSRKSRFEPGPVEVPSAATQDPGAHTPKGPKVPKSHARVVAHAHTPTPTHPLRSWFWFHSHLHFHLHFHLHCLLHLPIP